MPARSLVLWLAACILLLESAALAEEIGYNSHVRPILTEHCLHCHGNDRDADQSGPRLDLEEAAKKAGILKRAQSGAERTLESLLKSLGYEQIEIEFAPVRP